MSERRDHLALRYAVSGVRFLINAIQTPDKPEGPRSPAFEDLMASVRVLGEPLDGRARLLVSRAREKELNMDLKSSLHILEEQVLKLRDLVDTD